MNMVLSEVLFCQYLTKPYRWLTVVKFSLPLYLHSLAYIMYVFWEKRSLCSKFYIPLQKNKTVNRLVAGFSATRSERKVRATQGIPLPNGKRFARVCACRRKEPPSPKGRVRVRRWGKSPPGWWWHQCCAYRELKVHVNQRTQREGGPPELEGGTIEARGDVSRR